MNSLKRRSGWELHGHEVLEAHLSQAFIWGVSDCVTVAADVVLATCGVNLVPERDWTSRDEAMAAIKARGGLEAAVDAVLPPVGVLSAQRFDIGLWRRGLVSALVVCDGQGFSGKTEDGRLRVPRSEIFKAWASGR